MDFCEATEFGTVDGEAVGGSELAPRKVYVADDVITNPVQCWMNGFQDWCRKNNCPQTTHLMNQSTVTVDDYVVDASAFTEYIDLWLSDDMDPSDYGYEVR
ncbi:MAG: hypothetical protein AAGM67_02060 [Bacteroidota bacterium]